MPRAVDPWRKRFAAWQTLSQNSQAMTVLRRHWPLPYQMENIAAACAEFGLNPRSKIDRDVLLAILADILFKQQRSALSDAKNRGGAPVKWTEERIRKIAIG